MFHECSSKRDITNDRVCGAIIITQITNERDLIAHSAIQPSTLAYFASSSITMKFCAASLLMLASTAQAFTIAPMTTKRSATPKLFGYLDDLNKDLYAEADNPDIEADLKTNTDMSKEQMDRAGPGDWSSYVEFDEFDGGDGQMGVAGDGNKVR